MHITGRWYKKQTSYSKKTCMSSIETRTPEQQKHTNYNPFDLRAIPLRKTTDTAVRPNVIPYDLIFVVVNGRLLNFATYIRDIKVLCSGKAKCGAGTQTGRRWRRAKQADKSKRAFARRGE
jgi:hypothetical protein